MKIWIPDINDQIKLLKDWTFTLYAESRNSDLLLSAEEKSRLTKELRRINKEEEALNHHNFKDDKTYYQTDPGVYKMRPEVWAKIQALAKEEGIIRNKLNPNSYWRNKGEKLKGPETYTLKKGTVLEVDRIYIRKGAADYSSITFRIKGGKKSPRFFAKLEDVNKMECEPLGRNVKWPNGRFGIGKQEISQERNPNYTGVRGSGHSYYISCDPYFDYTLSFNSVSDNGQFKRGFSFGMGKENKVVKDQYCQSSSSKNFYSDKEKFIEACKRQGIPDKLVRAFIKHYEDKYK